jgi:DNA-binding SARP family transcriptional activator/transcriptional regulator with XRE-family HTH domain
MDTARHPPARGRIGALIRRHRLARGLTQQGLAQAADVSLGALRDLEQGRTRWPRWPVVESMATVLDLDQRQRAELMTSWPASPPAPAAPHPAPAVAPAAPPAPAGPQSVPRVAVLGPLLAWRDGAPVALGPPRQRALLGLLALHHGAPVHHDEIIDVLWGPRPPASAGTQIHGYISRRRGRRDPAQAPGPRRLDLPQAPGGRRLGPARASGGAGLIATDGPRYQLVADGGQLDLAAFRLLLERAGRVADAGRPGPASILYEQALALWRGDPLAGLDPLREHPAAVELGRQHSEAVLAYAAAARRAGVSHRAVPALRAACGREPLNEAAQAGLMLALAAAGQQAAALELFAGLRRRLAEELGVSPGPQLVQAHARVLRQQAPAHPARQL